MIKRDLAMLISRVLAILALFNAISISIPFYGLLPMLAMDFINSPLDSILNYLNNWALYFVRPFVSLVFINLAYLLWFHARIFAYWLTRGMDDDSVVGTRRIDEWQILFVSSLGLYLTGSTGSDYFRLYTAPKISGEYGDVEPYIFFMIVFRFLLGILLIFRCRAAVKWILGRMASE